MPVKASAYIKLGTALRYLIDVREGELLGGKHILANCRAVRQLIDELGFRATQSSEVFSHFEAQYVYLSKIQEDGQVAISDEDAGRLERVCRRVRDSLFGEAATVEIYPRSPGLPQKLTMSYLWNHVDLKLWVALAGLLGAFFTAGVKIGADPDAVLNLLGLK